MTDVVSGDGPLYYECHVTIEPVFDAGLDHFTEICKQHGFRPAKLLMQKRSIDTPVRSNKDTFCTGAGKDLDTLRDAMYALVKELSKNSFHVWRYKIEAVILDVRFG